MEVDEITRTLALVVAGDISEARYVSIQKYNQELSRDSPTYESLAQEKLNCYPAAEDLTITDISAKIKLQALMDLTSRRLLSSLATSTIDANQPLVLTSQWGIDRSASHSIYHGGSSVGEQAQLVHTFMISVVPRRLMSNGVTIWENELPYSVSFCRPILFKFMNDTKENVQVELATVEAEIEALTPTTLTDGITVTHQMMLTMIDDEYHPITSDTVASVCQICKANAIKKNPHLESGKWTQANKDVNKYGLSTLQAWIRSMQSLLEISYKLDINSWQAYSTEAKNRVNMKREFILEVLKNIKFVLNPSDQNDASVYRGRAAIGFFKLSQTFCKLTKLNFELVKQICIILQCISSGRKIILPRFREFCLDTAQRYMDLYPWYYMPSPLHKLLIHGPDFVENLSIIPIGMLCEGITEDTDGKFWKCRENSEIFHSSSWNEKYLRRLLLVSDPVLARIQPKVKHSDHKEFYILIGIEQKEAGEGLFECDDQSVLTDDSYSTDDDEGDDFYNDVLMLPIH